MRSQRLLRAVGGAALVAVTAFALVAIPRTVFAGKYGYPPEPPIIPHIPLPMPSDLNITQAIQQIANELRDRGSDPSGITRPIDIELGGPQRGQAFQNLTGGEQLAAAGQSPIDSFNAAAAAFESVLARNPSDIGARRGLIRALAGICGYGSLQGEGKSTDEACLQRAKDQALLGMQNAPNDPGLLHLLGNLESSLATRPGASAKERARAYAAAEAHYRKAVAGGYIFSQYALGVLYLSIGHFRNAREAFRAFQAAFPDAPPGLEAALRDLDKAVATEAGGKLDAGFEALLLRGNNDDAARLFQEGLADLHKMLGLPADQELGSAPAHDRFRHASAHYNLAGILAQQGKTDAAFKQLELALALGWARGSGPGDRRGQGTLRRLLESDPDFAALRQKDPTRWEQRIVPLLGK